MDRPHPRLVTLAELRDRTGVFRDREHAGEVLAGMLKTGLPRRSVLLAIPAGGVPTGHLDAVERVALAVDSVFCPNVRGGRSFAVAAAYRSWADVSEDEVRAILGRPEPGPS